jgi:hypothetical protein
MNYYLIPAAVGNYVACGTTPPSYDSAAHLWTLANGNRIAAMPGDYTLVDDSSNNPELLAAVKDEKKGAVTALRYEKETQGIVVNGAHIATTLHDQSRITGAKAYVDLRPDATIQWKTDTGVWVTRTAAEILALAGAVGDHVQALFTAECTHHAAIEALNTLAGLAAYDITTGWPE